jgi:hypothetical protein
MPVLLPNLALLFRLQTLDSRSLVAWNSCQGVGVIV